MSYKQNITSYGRLKGAQWFLPIANSRIFIGGAGGIGSHLAFLLARASANIVIVDDDTVGEENLAGQLYGKIHIGMPKVQAIKDVSSWLCGEDNVSSIQERIVKGSGQWLNAIPRCDVVCVGFDNLEARKIVYEQWKEKGKPHSLFVDGRLGFEGGQVFVVDHMGKDDDFLAYEATYFSAEESIELPCTMKATTHCGTLVASLMVAQITNWFSNTPKSLIKRNVRNIEFHLPIMEIKPSNFKLEQHVVVTE